MTEFGSIKKVTADESNNTVGQQCESRKETSSQLAVAASLNLAVQPTVPGASSSDRLSQDANNKISPISSTSGKLLVCTPDRQEVPTGAPLRLFDARHQQQSAQADREHNFSEIDCRQPEVEGDQTRAGSCGANTSGRLSIVKVATDSSKDDHDNNNNNNRSSVVELVSSNANCEQQQQPIKWFSSSSRDADQEGKLTKAAPQLTATGAAAGSFAAVSAELTAGKQQRELEVEWTIGRTGRSSFKHAIRSSVCQEKLPHEANTFTLTTNNPNNPTDGGPIQLVKSFGAKGLQSRGQAIGRRIKSIVNHFSGITRIVSKKASGERGEERIGSSGIEEEESNEPLIGSEGFLGGQSLERKLYCAESFQCGLENIQRAENSKSGEKSAGLVRGSVSCQSLLNKQQLKLNQRDSEAAELERTTADAQASRDEHCKVELLRKSASNWSGDSAEVALPSAQEEAAGLIARSINSKRNSMTSEGNVARNKHLIEDKLKKQQQHQGQRCNNAPDLSSGAAAAAAGRERFDDRRSTYCSSIGIVTSDLNCDSSFSSANNCSESNATCAMQHQHCSSSRDDFVNNTNQQLPSRDHHQEEKLQQPQPQAASSSTIQNRQQQQQQQLTNYNNDCNKSPSSNNSNNNNPAKKRRKPAQVLKARENWDKNIEFLLAVIGFAVDLGNVWRFPYICYKNGGGAFLIPYTIMFILGGLPIFYLEMSLGQYFSSGCLTVWKRVCPMAKGIGYAMCVLNFFTGLYYNTIISWAVFFFVQSFTNVLPWTSCNNHWNSANCRTIDQRQAIKLNTSLPNFTFNQNYSTDTNQSTSQVQLQQKQVYYSSPTKDYFEREVLQIHLSSGIDDLGYVREPLAIYLAIVFVCIYFAIWKGVKSTGKAVWITALLPYFVLIPLLIRGVFLEGAWLGIKYYLYPQWIKIIDVDVWVEAAKQIYFSLGPGFGTLMALSSYNKFNHNCCRDTLIAASVNYFASFISGLVIFAVLGYMATIENVSISDVATEGPGLVFQVYPEGLATMRYSSMWSVLFFLMVITLGIDSTFGGLESVITGLCDEYPRVLRAHRGIFIGILIILIYLCSLPTTTFGGNYVIYLLESYGTSLSLLFIVLVETIIVCWLYGADRFCKNLEEMYGEMPGAYWRICWKYISPTILLMIFIAACGQELDKYHTLTNGDYTYPGWAPTLGLLMTGSSVCCIPVYALYYLKTKVSGPFSKRLKAACTPIQDDESLGGDVYSEALTDHDAHLDTVI